MIQGNNEMIMTSLKNKQRNVSVNKLYVNSTGCSQSINKHHKINLYNITHKQLSEYKKQFNLLLKY